MSELKSDGVFSRRGLARNAAAGGAWLAASAGLSAGQSEDHPSAGGILDVRSFGAKGDGKTDDTKSIQQAIDLAAEKRAAVLLPPATYACSELQLRRNIALIGVPAWDYRGTGGSVLRLVDEKAKSLLNITGAPGVTIEGVSLDGGRLGKEIHGILLDKPDYGKEEDAFRIERCKVTRFTGDGVCLRHVWCFSVRHSMIASSGGDGIRCIGWDGFLLDNWLSGNRGAGFGGRGSASVTATGNRIEWNRDAGILLEKSNHYNITGNYIDRSGTSAIRCAASSRISISGNVIYRSGKFAEADSLDSSHIRLDKGAGIVVSANSLSVGRDDGGRGTWSPSLGIVYEGLENCVVKDNVLHNASLRELMRDLGSHGEGVIVKDNPGSIFKPPA